MFLIKNTVFDRCNLEKTVKTDSFSSYVSQCSTGRFTVYTLFIMLLYELCFWDSSPYHK